MPLLLKGRDHVLQRLLGEESSPAVSRLVRETSEAIVSVLNRFTLADLAREEQEAAERRQRNVTYFI